MKTMRNLTILGLLAFSAYGQQNSILQTSLSAAVTAQQTSIKVAAATGISAPSYSGGTAGSMLYIVDPGQTAGEAVTVTGVSGTTISVSRTGTVRAHVSGAMVLVATAPNWFYTVDPSGSCTLAQTYVAPWVNISTGAQWKCSTQTLSWVPSWGAPGAPQLLTATATASASGATAINGPLVEISGTNAITSFTMSTGWNGQSFCVIPTAAFTGTATNNIEKAFTAVADRTLCFTYNARLAAFAPSY